MHKEENQINTKISVLDFSAQKESHSKQKKSRCSALNLCRISVAPWTYIACTYPYINFS